MDGLDDIVEEFLVESHENLDQLDTDLVALEQEPTSRKRLASIFRTIHTIKGTSGFLAFHRLEEVTHVGETLLSRLRDGGLELTPARTSVLLHMVDTVRSLLASIEATGGEGSVDVSAVVAAVGAAMADTPAPTAVPAPREGAGAQPAPAEDDRPRRGVADSTIRVDVGLLDELTLLVGELAVTRNQIVQNVARQTDPDLVRACQRLNRIAGQLQEGVLKTRMQAIDSIWSKLPRVVRDLGLQCGKTVRLEMEGGGTELDRTLLEAVKDPLTHLVRNSVDHGVERPDERRAAGKPAEGVLTLRARHESGQVVVEVADDGAGIDPATLGATALQRGLVPPGALHRMSPTDVLQLIFLPGFSTAAAVTNVSGRGVGMDVVKTNVEAIGGSIEVESEPGVGTVCRLRIPLTLAIVPALIVECAGGRYAIPQTGLQELVSLDAGKAVDAVEEVGGVPVHRLRGDLLPLVRLTDVLGLTSDRHDGLGVLAVMRAEGRRFGLVVDRVIDTEEIVVTAVGGQIKAIGMYSGATVLGDGTVALILDVQALARRAPRTETVERQEIREAAPQASPVGTGRQRMLLAGIGGGRRVAIPLDAVIRLEQVRTAAVERVGNREVVRYRGAMLPIARLDRHLDASGRTDREVLDVIVCADHGRSVAVVVEQILDIVDGESAVCDDIDDLGLFGSAVLGDTVTELLDVRAAILAADPALHSPAVPARTAAPLLTEV